MKFSEIPGLSSIKEKLFRTVENGKVAHAQMFAGQEGSANLALALAYASFLNCTGRINQDSCGECPSCQKINKFIHPDLHFVFPVSAVKNKTGKDVISDSFIVEWRTFLAENPYGGAIEWSQEFGGENKQPKYIEEAHPEIFRRGV
jgi:DNA polymerase-3 subunit delta'